MTVDIERFNESLRLLWTNKIKSFEDELVVKIELFVKSGRAPPAAAKGGGMHDSCTYLPVVNMEYLDAEKLISRYQEMFKDMFGIYTTWKQKQQVICLYPLVLPKKIVLV